MKILKISSSKGIAIKSFSNYYYISGVKINSGVIHDHIIKTLCIINHCDFEYFVCDCKLKAPINFKNCNFEKCVFINHEDNEAVIFENCNFEWSSINLNSENNVILFINCKFKGTFISPGRNVQYNNCEGNLI